ncbi:MAG: ECF-type sigma factor [Balneolaceae bacterium]
MAQIDFSELVDALQKGDESKANELLGEVMPRLVDYLRIVMSADRLEATECAQQAFVDVFDQIKRDKIKEKKYIYSYMITTARNEFLRYKKVQHRFVSDPEMVPHQVEPARQIDALVEEERMKILRECLKELTQENRKLMNYFISHPDEAMKKVSKKFGLTNANLRTKKSRLTNRLHHCFKRKSSD